MAVLKIKIGTTVNPPISPIGSKNIITYLWRNSTNADFRRASTIRFLTKWDFVSDLYPLLNADYSSFRIIERGTYTPSEGHIVNNNVLNIRTASSPTTYLNNNTLYNFNILGTNLDGGQYRLEPLVSELRPIYIRYRLSNGTNEPPNIHTLYIVHSNPGLQLSSQHATLKIATIGQNSIIPISLNMFDNFDFIKAYLSGGSLPSDLSVFYTSEVWQTIQQFYPNISNSYILKIYFLKSNNSPAYTYGEIVDNRLKLNGIPVMYGQGIRLNQIISGQLLYDTQGLTLNSEINFYIGLEGFITGGIYI